MIQRILAIWFLVPLPFLNAAWTSRSSQFTYCWSLTWRILRIGEICYRMRWVQLCGSSCTLGIAVLWDCNENWPFPVLRPLVSLIFLKRSLVFPILLLSSISLHCSLRKVFLSLLAILWNSAFRWVYLSFSPLHFTSLVSSAICKAPLDNHFNFVHLFFLGMVLITGSCTMLWTSVHSSSGTLSIRSSPLNPLSLPLPL